MKLIVRRKVAVPVQSAPPVCSSGRGALAQFIHNEATALMVSMRECARMDGLESGDILVEVQDGAE